MPRFLRPTEKPTAYAARKGGKVAQRQDAPQVINTVVQGGCQDWETLEGLFASCDPRLLLTAPPSHGPDRLALSAALIAAATCGVQELRADAVCRVTGIHPRDLGAALGSLAKTNARVEADLDGQFVRVGKPQSRVLRPSLYVRVLVSGLATAPSGLHARAGLIAEQASRRTAGELRMPTAQARRWLGLRGQDDVGDAFAGILPWVQENMAGFQVDIRIDDDDFIIQGTRVPTGKAFVPDAIRLGYLGQAINAYWIVDGSIHGHQMTVRPVLAAKAWQWAREQYCITAPFREVRWLWLSAVQAWADGLPTGLPFWPVERFGAELGERSASEVFADFAIALAEASDRIEMDQGPLWRVMEHDGRKLETERLKRVKAQRTGRAADPVVGRSGNTPITRSQWTDYVTEVSAEMQAAGIPDEEIRTAIKQEAAVNHVAMPTHVDTQGQPVMREHRPFPRVQLRNHLLHVEPVVHHHYGDDTPDPLPPDVRQTLMDLARRVTVLVSEAPRGMFKCAAAGQSVQWNVIYDLAKEALWAATSKDAALKESVLAFQRIWQSDALADQPLHLDSIDNIIAAIVAEAWQRAVRRL